MPSIIPQILLSLYSSASQIQKHPPESSKAHLGESRNTIWKDAGSLSHHLDKSFPREPSTFSFFHWRIIALQHCVGFCHTPTWISHIYIRLLPPIIPPLLLVKEHWTEFPVLHSNFPLAIWFTYENHPPWMIEWARPFPLYSAMEHSGLICYSRRHYLSWLIHLFNNSVGSQQVLRRVDILFNSASQPSFSSLWGRIHPPSRLRPSLEHLHLS